MSQYKTGRVFLRQGSADVYANYQADWSGVAVGDWLVAEGVGITMSIQAVAQEVITSYSLHIIGNTFTVGAKVKDVSNLGYICINAAPANTALTNAAYWMRLSGWVVTLTAPWAPASIANSVYGILTDFTSGFALPLPQAGDLEIPAVISRAFAKIDDYLTSPAGDLPVVPDALPIGKSDGTEWLTITVSDLWAQFSSRSYNFPWSLVSGKPTTFTPESHTHAISDITSLSASLAAKLNTSTVGAANGVSPLDGSSKVPYTNLPDGTVAAVVTVANQAARLALSLSSSLGKIIYQTDTGQAFCLKTSGNPSVLGDWQVISDSSLAISLSLIHI